MPRNAETIPCPYCGEPIKKNAPACPYCGSDERTGWSEERYLDDVDLPEDTDYDEILRKEFPAQSGPPKKIPWIAIAGAVVLLCFVGAMLKMIL
jgi:hypothetical protein